MGDRIRKWCSQKTHGLRIRRSPIRASACAPPGPTARLRTWEMAEPSADGRRSRSAGSENARGRSCSAKVHPTRPWACVVESRDGRIESRSGDSLGTGCAPVALSALDLAVCQGISISRERSPVSRNPLRATVRGRSSGRQASTGHASSVKTWMLRSSGFEASRRCLRPTCRSPMSAEVRAQQEGRPRTDGAAQ